MRPASRPQPLRAAPSPRSNVLDPRPNASSHGSPVSLKHSQAAQASPPPPPPTRRKSVPFCYPPGSMIQATNGTSAPQNTMVNRHFASPPAQIGGSYFGPGLINRLEGFQAAGGQISPFYSPVVSQTANHGQIRIPQGSLGELNGRMASYGIGQAQSSFSALRYATPRNTPVETFMSPPRYRRATASDPLQLPMTVRMEDKDELMPHRTAPEDKRNPPGRIMETR